MPLSLPNVSHNWMVSFLFSIILASHLLGATADTGVHLQIQRRGSRFARHEPANLTALQKSIHDHEKRYIRTYRKIEGNRLIRKWHPDQADEVLLDDMGYERSWYTSIEVGNPPQVLEVDLDMLRPDWLHAMTSSGTGSKYDTFLSTTHVLKDQNVHPICRLSSDTFHLPCIGPVSDLNWPLCKPSHSSRQTLRRSGSILGLAPNNEGRRSSLSQLESSSLLNNLFEKGTIAQAVWSITILDSTTGILSLGGTLARQVEEVKARLDVQLKYLGQQDVDMSQIENEINERLGLLGPTIDEQFKWTDVHGAEGWWQGLISGVFVNGVKILKNQPFILDLSTPFVHIPTAAIHQLQSSIPGSISLPSPHDRTFSAFPCLNPPKIALEIAGWRFILGSDGTREDVLYGPVGGPLSLGKIENLDFDLKVNDTDRDARGKEDEESIVTGSGYCVSILVGKSRPVDVSSIIGADDMRWSESGMDNIWILGEPFFRGNGIVFDEGSSGSEGKEKRKARMGFRNY